MRLFVIIDLAQIGRATRWWSAISTPVATTATVAATRIWRETNVELE